MSDQEAIKKISDDVESAIRECGVHAISALPKFMQALQMAKGVRALRTALEDNFVKWALMPLMGSTLGFLTDLDSKPEKYSVQVVRDCAIEAMLRGFNIVGNEFNIIAGRFYGTKNGYERLVLEFPGLRDLVLQPGVPTLAGDKGALVPFTATWTLNGKAMCIDCQQTKDGPDLRIPVKLNTGMGPDAIIGKATRKMLFRIYQRVNGSTYGATDGEVGDEVINTTGEPAPSPVPAGTPEGRRIKLGGKSKATGQGTPVAPEGAAAQATTAPTPPPSATAPAAAPKGLVDVVKLVQMLRECDGAWDDPDVDAVSTVQAWNEKQRVEALNWASAVLGDGPLVVQANRPGHTLIGRQPGEEG
jgi:hypothetical protein